MKPNFSIHENDPALSPIKTKEEADALLRRIKRSLSWRDAVGKVVCSQAALCDRANCHAQVPHRVNETCGENRCLFKTQDGAMFLSDTFCVPVEEPAYRRI